MKRPPALFGAAPKIKKKKEKKKRFIIYSFLASRQGYRRGVLHVVKAENRARCIELLGQHLKGWGYDSLLRKYAFNSTKDTNILPITQGHQEGVWWSKSDVTWEYDTLELIDGTEDDGDDNE